MPCFANFKRPKNVLKRHSKKWNSRENVRIYSIEILHETGWNSILSNKRKKQHAHAQAGLCFYCLHVKKLGFLVIRPINGEERLAI